MCDTGIALLAYMDGITGSPTLGGVVLAVLAAAGYAVFKVSFFKEFFLAALRYIFVGIFFKFNF